MLLQFFASPPAVEVACQIGFRQVHEMKVSGLRIIQMLDHHVHLLHDRWFSKEIAHERKINFSRAIILANDVGRSVGAVEASFQEAHSDFARVKSG
jgi:hypothetical protein